MESESPLSDISLWHSGMVAPVSSSKAPRQSAAASLTPAAAAPVSDKVDRSNSARRRVCALRVCLVLCCVCPMLCCVCPCVVSVALYVLCCYVVCACACVCNRCVCYIHTHTFTHKHTHFVSLYCLSVCVRALEPRALSSLDVSKQACCCSRCHHKRSRSSRKPAAPHLVQAAASGESLSSVLYEARARRWVPVLGATEVSGSV